MNIFSWNVVGPFTNVTCYNASHSLILKSFFGICATTIYQYFKKIYGDGLFFWKICTFWYWIFFLLFEKCVTNWQMTKIIVVGLVIQKRKMIFWQPFSCRQLPFILFIYFSNFLLRLELRALWVSCQVIVHFKMSK
jgi:hypothetical protein